MVLSSFLLPEVSSIKVPCRVSGHSWVTWSLVCLTYLVNSNALLMLGLAPKFLFTLLKSPGGLAGGRPAALVEPVDASWLETCQAPRGAARPICSFRQKYERTSNLSEKRKMTLRNYSVE